MHDLETHVYHIHVLIMCMMTATISQFFAYTLETEHMIEQSSGSHQNFTLRHKGR